MFCKTITVSNDLELGILEKKQVYSAACLVTLSLVYGQLLLSLVLSPTLGMLIKLRGRSGMRATPKYKAHTHTQTFFDGSKRDSCTQCTYFISCIFFFFPYIDIHTKEKRIYYIVFTSYFSFIYLSKYFSVKLCIGNIVFFNSFQSKDL